MTTAVAPARGRPSALVIGAGSTGAATAHDLSLRGVAVTVIDRGEVASGTTGRNHGLLHSGARYAVKDPESARECIVERDILARIAPEILELNGGLFVAVDDAGLAYRESFLEACAQAGIPARCLSPTEVRCVEPALSPSVVAAVEVPDGVFDPWHLCLAFLATARGNGASRVGVALADAPPKARFTAVSEIDLLTIRKNRIAIRHGSDHTVVAIIEIVSPGNKSSRHAVRAFTEKAIEILANGIHLLVIDLFPPGPRDPEGIHKAIWSEIEDDHFALPTDKRLTLVSYAAGLMKRAFIGSLWIARRIASRATSSFTPDSSKSTRPGLTLAIHHSGDPLPEPIRVSAGFLVNGRSG